MCLYGKSLIESKCVLSVGGKNVSTTWNVLRQCKVIGQGRENAKLYLEKNPKVAEEIETAIRTKAGLISKKIEGNPTPKEKETDK